MIHISINNSLNLLTVSYRQHVTLTELQQLRPQIEALLQQLQPGFQLLTDLSGLDSMDYACAEEIGQLMNLWRAKGLGKVVRIISDPKKDIGFKVLSYFHYGHDVPVATCETVAEAMEHLSA